MITCDCCGEEIKDYIRESYTMADWVVEGTQGKFKLLCSNCHVKLQKVVMDKVVFLQGRLRRRALRHFMKKQPIGITHGEKLPQSITLNNRDLFRLASTQYVD